MIGAVYSGFQPNGVVVFGLESCNPFGDGDDGTVESGTRRPEEKENKTTIT
jgi:hypothetical protein